MATEILMPALSPTMEEGTLAKWLVREGDSVSSGDILAEIETDKATMEFEAVDEGIVGKILVAEGTTNVKVNTPIAVLVEDGESADTAAASPATASPATDTAKPEPRPVAAAARSAPPDRRQPAPMVHPQHSETHTHQPSNSPVARAVGSQAAATPSHHPPGPR